MPHVGIQADSPEEYMHRCELEILQVRAALKAAGTMLWDLLHEAPVPGHLPLWRHDEIHIWLSHWTPEVYGTGPTRPADARCRTCYAEYRFDRDAASLLIDTDGVWCGPCIAAIGSQPEPRWSYGRVEVFEAEDSPHGNPHL